MVNKREKGQRAEEMAANFLKMNGYEIIARNYFTREGEIDIIAIEKRTKTLVFVEVRSLNSYFLDSPLETITLRKLARIYKAVKYFLFENPQYRLYPKRVDFIGIQYGKLFHIKNITGMEGL